MLNTPAVDKDDPVTVPIVSVRRLLEIMQLTDVKPETALHA